VVALEPAKHTLNLYPKKRVRVTLHLVVLPPRRSAGRTTGAPPPSARADKWACRISETAPLSSPPPAPPALPPTALHLRLSLAVPPPPNPRLPPRLRSPPRGSVGLPPLSVRSTLARSSASPPKPYLDLPRTRWPRRRPPPLRPLVDHR
jgi:hypothetical protein